MRIDAPIFIPSGNTSPSHTQTQSPSHTDGPHWLALETVCAAHERHRKKADQGDTTPPVVHAARVLDTLDATLEALIGRLALNPDNYRTRHDSTPIPREALQAFHQAIVRRDVLSRSIEVDPKALVALLRPLTGLSARWVSDRRLAHAVPADLMSQLRRALVFILFPGETLPDMQPGELCPHPDELKEAINRMGTQWDHWAQTVAQLALPPALPPSDFPVERMIAGRTLIELARTNPADRAMLANARLDHVDFIAEENLQYAATTPWLAEWAGKKNDNDQATWAALKAVLHARSTARPDLALIGKTLATVQTTLGVALEPRAALMLPMTQTHALARSVAGHAEATGLDPANAMAELIDNLSEYHPQAWNTLCQQVDRVATCFHDLSDQHPLLNTALGTMWHAFSSAKRTHDEAHHTLGAEVFSAASQALESLRAEGETSDAVALKLNQAISVFREQHASELEGTELPMWLAALSRQAERNRADTQALTTPLTEIGLGGDPGFAYAFADAARGAADQRAAAARKLFEQFKALPQKTQDDLTRKAGLHTPRPQATTRALLTTWRASDAPHLPGLADLFERVSSRIREHIQKQASQRIHEGEHHLLNEAIERAKQERSQPKPKRTGNTVELDVFVAKLPTRGDTATRQRAVRTALQELSPLALCVLLIETSNTLLAHLVGSQKPGPDAPAAMHQPTTLSYIINESARLVRHSKAQPNLGELRANMRGLLNMVPLSSMLDTAPDGAMSDRMDTKLADRLMMCLDNFASWVHTISNSIDEPARIRILQDALQVRTPLDHDEAKRIWNAQIRDAARINGMDNYLDLRFEMSQIPAIGPQVLKIWNTTLDVHSARLGDSVRFSEMSGDWQKALNLANASIRQLRDRLGSGFIVLSQLPDFRDTLDKFLSFSGSIAGGHGRANVGAMLAYHIVYVVRALSNNPFLPLP